MEKKFTKKEIEYATEGKNFSFSCTKCGNCCKGVGSIYFSDTELNKIYKYLGLSREKDKEILYKKLIQRKENSYHIHDINAPCFFLKNNICSIYKVRPLQCKTFPFWPSVFQSPDDLQWYKKECPGISTASSNSKIKKENGYSYELTAKKINFTSCKFTLNQKNIKKPITL